MSDLQEKTAKVIAEAEVLLEKASADVRRSRELLNGAGADASDYRRNAEAIYGPGGAEVFDDLLEQCRKTMRNQENAALLAAGPVVKMRQSKYRRLV